MQAKLIGSVFVDGVPGGEEMVVVSEVGGNRCMTAHTDEAVSVVAADFGANVENMDGDDVALWILRNEGREISVSPDFWVSCLTQGAVAAQYPKSQIEF